MIIEEPQIKPAAKHQQQSEAQSKNNQESSIYYTKNKKIIFWIYIFVLVTFVVSQATLVSYNWKNYQTFSTSDSYFFANQIVYEWQKGFITDAIITSSSNCPTNYDHAFNFTWPGTSFGCFCQVDVNSSFVIQGYCSPKLIQASCRNIQSQKPISASIWKNSSNICIKRSSVSFLTEQKYNGNNKICGSSKSLTIMPQSEPCPIVNITFGDPSLQDHYSLVSDPLSLLPSLYSAYNSTSPYSFYSYPISKFTVSEYQFCQLDDDSGLSPDHIQFVLLNQKRGCADTGNYSTLDSITQIQFYANNPSLNQLSNINGFPKPTNAIYLLGFSNLPSWTYNCRHNYDSKFSMPRTTSILNFDFFKSYYYIALVQILLYSALGFQLFILVIRRILKREVYPVGYRQMYLPKDFCEALMRYVIDAICKMAVLGLLIYTAYTIFINWNWFKSALNLECADKNQMLISNIMQPYRDMYQKSLYYVVAQLVIFLFVAIIDIIHFVYIYRNDLCYYLVDSYNKVLVEHTAKDELDWIDKQGDKKLIDIQNLDKIGLDNDAASEKFKATMAFNFYDNQKNIEDQPVRGKVVKKKKKKFGAFKKDYQNTQLKASDQLNPYGFDNDATILGLNSIDNLSGQPRETEDNRNNSKNNDRARRKKK